QPFVKKQRPLHANLNDVPLHLHFRFLPALPVSPRERFRVQARNTRGQLDSPSRFRSPSPIRFLSHSNKARRGPGKIATRSAPYSATPPSSSYSPRPAHKS